MLPSRSKWFPISAVLAASLLTIAWAADEVSEGPKTAIEPRAKPEANKNPVPRANIRIDSTLVLIPVTVTDALNRFVTGLDKENFKLFEEKKEQEIISFSSEDAPLSIGLVFDCSGSMGGKLEKSREAVAQFFKTANPDDEFFLVQFNDTADLVQHFTTSLEEIQNRLTFTQSKGRTALLDAILLAIDEMKKAKNPRKALLVISDGGDNRSRYTEGEVKSQVREADVEIYSIGIFDPYAATPEERTGPLLLNELCEETGGRMFRVDDLSEMSDIAEKISTELRNQYVIGYTPKDIRRDGKWRKVKVKLNPPQGLPPLTVHARTGYYAPLQ